MTNKTEDRFYFGKSGQPERFSVPTDVLKSIRAGIAGLAREASTYDNEGNRKMSEMRWRDVADLQKIAAKIEVGDGSPSHAKQIASLLFHLDTEVRDWIGSATKKWLRDQRAMNSRPGQPERFAGDTQYSNMGSETRARMRVWINSTFKTAAERDNAERRMEKVFVDDPAYWSRMSWEAVAKYADVFSRTGQPERFDASSLDRGNFAEASKSPMLGKLLSAKVMPEGGWRAVQVGSDTLVISFEDADLARDFGRRCASKGYSATSPVATTGRYWNVEVKNGGK